jgi:hypothetical protein
MAALGHKSPLVVMSDAIAQLVGWLRAMSSPDPEEIALGNEGLLSVLWNPEYLGPIIEICSARPPPAPIDISVMFLCRLVRNCDELIPVDARMELLEHLFAFLTPEFAIPLAPQFELCVSIWSLCELVGFPPDAVFSRCASLVAHESAVPTAVFLFATVLKPVASEWPPPPDTLALMLGTLPALLAGADPHGRAAAFALLRSFFRSGDALSLPLSAYDGISGCLQSAFDLFFRGHWNSNDSAAFFLALRAGLKGGSSFLGQLVDLPRTVLHNLASLDDIWLVRSAISYLAACAKYSPFAIVDELLDYIHGLLSLWQVRGVDADDFSETHNFLRAIAAFCAEMESAFEEIFLPVANALLADGSSLLFLLVLRAIYSPFRAEFSECFACITQAVCGGLDTGDASVVAAACALAEEVADATPDQARALLAAAEGRLRGLAAADCALAALSVLYGAAAGSTLDGNAVVEALAAELPRAGDLHASAALGALAELVRSPTPVDDSHYGQVLDFAASNIGELNPAVLDCFGSLVWRSPLLAAARVRDFIAAFVANFAAANPASRRAAVRQLTNVAPPLCASLRGVAPAVDALLAGAPDGGADEEEQLAAGELFECRAVLLRVCGGGFADALADAVFARLCADDAGKEALLRAAAELLLASAAPERFDALLREAAGSPRAAAAAWEAVRSVLAQAPPEFAVAVGLSVLDAAGERPAAAAVDAVAALFVAARGALPIDAAAAAAELVQRAVPEARAAVPLAVVLVVRCYPELLAHHFDAVFQALAAQVRVAAFAQPRPALDALAFLAEARPDWVRPPVDRVILRDAHAWVRGGDTVGEAALSLVRTIARFQPGLFAEREIAELVRSVDPAKNSYAVVWDAKFVCFVARCAPALLEGTAVVQSVAVRVLSAVEMLFGLFSQEEVALFAGALGSIDGDVRRLLADGHEDDLEMIAKRLGAIA